MKIDITSPPDLNIFRDRKKYAIWFTFFMVWVAGAAGIGIYAFYFDTGQLNNPEDWALGILVAASIGITWSGNHLQSYKKLYPPQLKKLAELRTSHALIDKYCLAAEQLDRRLIRAEFEAFVDYSEKHSAVPFT